MKKILGQSEAEGEVMRLATKWYEEMKTNYQRFLKIENIHSGHLDHEIISPNQLHVRFKPPSLMLIHTNLQNKISKKIDDEINNHQNQIYIKGPIGIGKSHALLAKALDLRMQIKKNIVVYLNNPLGWIASKYNYISKELVYAMMPFREMFTHNPVGLDEVLPQTLPTQESLFKWLYLLIYQATMPDIMNRDEPFKIVLSEFLQQISSFADRKELKIYCISDQENLFRNPKDPASKREDQFPFAIRYTFGNFQIMTASANNDTSEIQTRFRATEFFERLTSIK